jgi:protein gp37
MGENSAIEWTDHTFNPWVGCTKISPACDHCYAEGWAKRTGQPEMWHGKRRRTTPANWREPLKWNAAAQKAGERARAFCASLADVFDNQVPEEWRSDLWSRISATKHLDWLLLTKRPQNIAKMLPETWGNGWPNVWLGTTVENQDEADRRIPHLLAVPAAVRFLSCEPLLGAVDLSGFHIGWSECDECGYCHDPNEDYPLESVTMTSGCGIPR